MKVLHTLLLLTSLSGISSAALTMSQTQNFSFTPAASQALVFNKFDTQGGTRTLLSVTITTSLTKVGGALYVDNDSPTAASGSISQSVTINLTSGNVSLIDENLIGLTGAASVTANSYYFASLTADDGDGVDYQAGGSDWGGTTFGNVTESETSGVGSIGLYSGAGTYTITATGSQTTDTSAVSGVSGSFTPAGATGFVTITYTYVPEPTSTMLGGLGMIVLLTRYRRR